ncbi:MAG: polymerase beta, Nucleotidyltransferase, partial [Candidatus Eremiobacteraeota bacterium]|nr:polymerase beta, Nucleotidyltransferase [Candidatus Eremiobacteraeota bacterium]
ERRRLIEAIVDFLEERGIEKYALARSRSAVSLSLPNAPEHLMERHVAELRDTLRERFAGQLSDVANAVARDMRDDRTIVVKMRPSPAEPSPTEAIVRILKGEENELRRRGVVSLLLFGSTASGKADANDVDLLARFRPDVRLSAFDVANLQRYLEERVDRRVDLSNEKSFPAAWAKQVKDTGISIFGS